MVVFSLLTRRELGEGTTDSGTEKSGKDLNPFFTKLKIGMLLVRHFLSVFSWPQCRIIRTTELAAAQEKLNELERQKEEILKFYSPACLLHRLQGNNYSCDYEIGNNHHCDNVNDAIIMKITWLWWWPEQYLWFAETMNKTEEESETLHRQLLDREMDLGAFVQKYKRLRTTYHRRALTHLAAKTSSTGW